jgi:hypothetical protein
MMLEVDAEEDAGYREHRGQENLYGDGQSHA